MGYCSLDGYSSKATCEAAGGTWTISPPSYEYAYYIKGHNLALVERDTTLNNDLNSRDFGPGSNRAQWKSALSSVTDGIELQYVYSPLYRLTSTTTVTVNNFRSNTGGKLRLTLADATTLNRNDFIVISGSDRWNGLHQVDADTTTTSLILKTKYVGAVVTESFNLNVNVDVLNDEKDEIDLPEYLSKALVDYVKAKMAEEVLNIEAKEYFMKEFRKKVEKFNNSRITGIRLVTPGSHSIR